MIDNVSNAFDNGEVTVEHVEQMLALVFPDDETARDERRQRVIVDGKVVKFQLVALNKQAKDAMREGRIAKPAEPEVPEQFLIDVPEDIGDHRGPDYVPEIKNRLGIIAAVRMFGKPQGEIRSSRTEGIKVRCPFPFHEDNRPSAWVNTEKNTWYCGKCQCGGDVIDFYAAARHSLEPDQFHHSPEFRSITEEMAEVLNIEVELPVDTSAWASPLPDPPAESEELETPTAIEDQWELQADDRDNDPPVPQKQTQPVVPPSSEANEPVTISTDEMVRGIVVPEEVMEDEAEPEISFDTPSYNPDRVGIPEGTFLYSWLDQHKEELPWVPPEYFLMLGFQALGLASGHHITSRMYGLPLTGALMMTLIGPSGYGKSTAAGRLRRLISTVDGPMFKKDLGVGIKAIPSAGSAEALVMYMRTDIEDPNDAAAKLEVPTTGWLFEDEFATFIERTRRRGGSHLKQRLMQFYDFVKESPDPELVIHEFSMSGGLRVVHDSFLSALFLTQTQAIRTLAERADLVSGFLNRIIPVFGEQPVRRKFDADMRMDPNPEYFSLYEDVWRKCREDCTIGNPIVMPFTNDALTLAKDHPFFEQAEKLGDQQSIYARLTHITLRLALLLAINDRVPDVMQSGKTLKGHVVEPDHLRGAIDIVQNLIQPGYHSLVEAVSADEVDELAREVISYLQGHYARKGRWPAVSEVMARSFWRKYASAVRPKAMDHLRFSRQIAELRLVSGNQKKIDVIVATSGPWASFSSHSGKTFKSEDFYAAANTNGS